MRFVGFVLCPPVIALCLCELAAGAQASQPQAARGAQAAAAARQRAAAQGAFAGSVARQLESVQRQLEATGSTRIIAVVRAQEPGGDCPPLAKDDLADLLRETAQRDGLTPDLLRAVIGKESAFRPCAVSRKGAAGLMQLMPETARDLGVSDPFDPRQNVSGGSRLLKRLLERYGNDLTLALGAYNAGPSQVDRYNGLPPFVETIDYVKDILGGLNIPTGPADGGDVPPTGGEIR